MSQKLSIGYFEHWFQPPYKFVDFLKEQGVEIEKIDFSQKNYLEKYDVALIEQNGFNDYIENDELYIQNWVSRGGILIFMHQDYMRWAPYFLPRELGHVQLIHRYIPTINPYWADETYNDDESPYMAYMMPWIENCGKRLFSQPEEISSVEMIDWKLDVNTFRILRPHKKLLDGIKANINESDYVRTTAQSCYQANEKWEVLGSFKDPGVKDGALILKANYGKGMFFLNQILFPEIFDKKAEKCLSFWKKYVKNLLAYFERFKNGESEDMPEVKKELPIKKNYKMSIHMHSLDWYAADSHLGTINAMMKLMNFDIVSVAIKDDAPYDGNLDVNKFSDDKVLFLDGQEYHPFNWNDKNAHLSHNTYHTLAIGTDPDAYTMEFTCSLFSDEEVDAAVKKAISYVHEHGGAACSTHPAADSWFNYDYDAVDKEPMTPLSGTNIEKYWLKGGRIAVMNSVDLYGLRRLLDNPATNFIYLKGEKPCRDSVVRAIRGGHTIAACGFNEADICIGDFLPGDEISMEEAKNGTLSITAKVMKHEIKKVRVYSGAEVIFEKNDLNSAKIDIKLPLNDYKLDKFIRVEIEGLNEHWICNSTPFYMGVSK